MSATLNLGAVADAHEVPADAQGAPGGDLRRGCTRAVHGCLDLLDARRALWSRRGEEHIEGDIEVYTARPATAAELLEGAAMMIFLAERRVRGAAAG